MAFIHLIASVLGGVAFTWFVAEDAFEKVLMAISWYAITATSIDVLATTDVRVVSDE